MSAWPGRKHFGAMQHPWHQGRVRHGFGLLCNPFQAAGSARYDDGLSYGAIMRQRDFLNFVSAWNTRLSVGAMVLIVLCGASAHAQLVPGDSPNTGIGAAVANTPNRPGGLSTSRVPGGTRSDAQADQHYREALKRIPDRKAPKDPWATIRTAPTADRHQPQ
jgi:hypothetical protein